MEYFTANTKSFLISTFISKDLVRLAENPKLLYTPLFNTVHMSRFWPKGWPVEVKDWPIIKFSQKTENLSKMVWGVLFLTFCSQYQSLRIVVMLAKELQFITSVIRQKGESQNGCFKKTKHAKFSEKQTFLTPWYAHVR